MPEVEYMTTIGLPRERIWDFVKDMNNWAPFLIGYQGHEVIDAQDSVWTLKGDMGVLSRTVRLRAHITEWSGPARVSFTLSGLNEIVEGGGTLQIEELPAGEQAQPGGSMPAPRARGLQALWQRIVRFFFRRLRQPAAERQLPAAESGAASRLTFTLRMEAGGPLGPVANSMMAPLLLPTAEDLANKIAGHLERARPARTQ